MSLRTILVLFGAFLALLILLYTCTSDRALAASRADSSRTEAHARLAA